MFELFEALKHRSLEHASMLLTDFKGTHCGV